MCNNLELIFLFNTDWYIGTESGSADILPRAEVSFNNSLSAEIEGGLLLLNGIEFANISEIIALQTGEMVPQHFVFEPGRLIFNTLELCNFVHRCVPVNTHPSILISK